MCRSGHEEGQQLERDYVLERLRPMLESGKAGLAADDKKSALAASDKTLRWRRVIKDMRWRRLIKDMRWRRLIKDMRWRRLIKDMRWRRLIKDMRWRRLIKDMRWRRIMRTTDMTVLANYGINVERIAFDTMIAAHLCGRTRTSIGLKPLALSLLHEDMTPIEDLIGRGRNQITMDKVEIAKAADYAAADADMTYRLVDVFEKELEENNLRVTFDTLEMPLVPVAGEDAEGRRCYRHGCACADVC